MSSWLLGTIIVLYFVVMILCVGVLLLLAWGMKEEIKNERQRGH